MTHIHIRKRATHRRRVLAELQHILNDLSVMPNADAPDLIVFVRRVEFGNTVREIFIDVEGKWRYSRDLWSEMPHDRYMRAAKAKGHCTYIDLTDMFLFPQFTEIIARELQRRLGLLYTPTIRRFCDLGQDERN